MYWFCDVNECVHMHRKRRWENQIWNQSSFSCASWKKPLVMVKSNGVV
jgi:hypothetical protein